MTTVSEIAARTAAIAENAAQIASSLDYEAREISSTMERIQGSFGDQAQGQQAVMALNSALTKVITAGAAMRDGRTHGTDFVSKILS